MLKKKMIGILIGIMILATAGAIVYARAGSFVPDFILKGMKAHMIEDLELTPDQVEGIEAIFEEIKDEIPDMRKHHQEIHEDFSRQFVNNTLDQEAIKETLEKKLVELRSMTDFMIAKVAEFHAILTPEQREKVVQHMQEIKEIHAGGFGPGLRHGHFPGSR